MKEKVIALIDMDAFFASIEQRDNPKLKDKPVLISGSSPYKGIITTCSYEARKYGCYSGMPVIEARRNCPNGYYIVGNHDKYVYTSKQIIKICRDFTPLVEPFSVDEMFLDLTGSIEIFKNKKYIAKELKNTIKNKISLPCSIGLAPNKILAKISCKLAKPNGIFIMNDHNKKKILCNLPIEKLFGIGNKTKDKLNKLGIYNTKDLKNFSRDILETKFGKIADHLIKLAQGKVESKIISENYEHRPKSISNETTLFEPTNNYNHIKKIILALTQKVSFRLRKQNAKAKTVKLRLRTSDFKTTTKQISFNNPVFFESDIFERAVNILSRFDLNKTKIRLIGIGVSKLSFNDDIRQLDIFQYLEMDKHKLTKAIDKLKNKFGKQIINVGDTRLNTYKFRSNSNPPLSFGMKNYIKEESEHDKDNENK